MDVRTCFGYLILFYFKLDLTLQEVLSDPIGFWPMNKLHGFQDIGPHKFNTTGHGVSLTTGHKGQPDTAYQFAETSHGALHVFPASSKLNQLDSFTVLLSIKPQYPYPVPIWTWKTTTERLGCMLGIDEAGDLVFRGEGSDGVNRTIKDDLPIAPDEWQILFLSYTRKNGIVNLKVRQSDKTWLDAPKKSGFDLPMSSLGDFLIGANIFGHQYLTGVLDCMLLFDEALHKHEVGKAVGLCDTADAERPTTEDPISTATESTTTAATTTTPKSTTRKTTTITTTKSTTTTTETTTTTTPETTTTKKPESSYITAPYKRTKLICDDDTTKNAEWAYSNKSGNCYRLFNEKKDFQEALAACTNIGGTLAEVKYKEEQTFLDEVLEKDYIDHWVHGTRVAGQNYTWGANYEAMDYWNWFGNKQPSGTDTCMVVTKNYVPPSGAYAIYGRWISSPCTRKTSYICQKQAKRCPKLPWANHTVPEPPHPYIELTIQYKCAPGYELPDYEARYKAWKVKIAALKNATSATSNTTVAPSVPAKGATTTTATPTTTSTPNDTSLIEPKIKTNPTMDYKCSFPGNWTNGTIAPCEPISCVEPPKMPHTTLNSTNVVYPSFIGYKCDLGYFYRRYNTTVMTAWCGPDKQWIDVPKKCDTVECDEFPMVFNATANAKKNRFKDKVTWQCNDGYMFPDGKVRQTIECKENYVNVLKGRWSEAKLPDCERLTCPPLATPALTTRDNNDTEYESMVTFTCVSDEYEFPDGQDTQTVRCSHEAQWKPINTPGCLKKPSVLETKGKKYLPAPMEATAAESIEKPAKLPTKGKKYLPKPMDSPAAKGIGIPSLLFMIIFLVCIVLLDLTTICKDIRLCRRNLRRFSKKVSTKKKDTSQQSLHKIDGEHED